MFGNRSRLPRTTLFGCALLLTVGCPLVVLPAAILVGFFAGRMGVTFTPGSTSTVVSDGEGRSRLEFRENGDGSSRFESYEGILPGFVELGATMGVVELGDGTVSGVVTTPDGEEFNLSDILPGLRAERQENATGFDLVFQDGGAEYIYSMTLDMELEESGSKLNGTVSIRRLVLQDGQIVLDDSGEGTIETEAEQNPGDPRPLPLDPLPPPIIIDAGPAKTIELGGSTMLEATVRGGSELTVSWSPSLGLDDPEAIQPTASPETTTTYTLTVTDTEGQRAIDVVVVTVVRDTDPDPDDTGDEESGECIRTEIDCGSDETCDPETGDCTPDPECKAGDLCDDDDPDTEDRCESGVCIHTAPECETLSGDITTDTTLNAPCYVVESTVSVRGDATLTIAAGVTLKFRENTALHIGASFSGGKLQAVGTAVNPIVFTGEQQSRGFWGGVVFSSSDFFENQLDHVTIEFGGRSSAGGQPQANLYLKSSRVKVTNCTLRNGDGYGIRIANPKGGEFTNNEMTGNALGAAHVTASFAGFLDDTSTFSGNDTDVVVIDGGKVLTDDIWVVIDAFYLITNDVDVRAPLTIEAGVKLIFQQNAGMAVTSGALRAVGTTEDPIIFTGEQQIPGYWDGLDVQSNSFDNVLDHVTIEYGGADALFQGWRANLRLITGRVTATNCTFSFSALWGIFLGHASTLIVDAEMPNSFEGNTNPEGGDISPQ